MKIAITGSTGRIGQCVAQLALGQGHEVVGLDNVDPPGDMSFISHPSFTFIKADLQDYDATYDGLVGCDALIQLAAFPSAGDYSARIHNNNVVISWNVLWAAAQLGIERIALASSVNAIGLVYNASRRFDYFPIDENHLSRPDEGYGLSKQILEMQADAIVRRYPNLRIASLRLSWAVPQRSDASWRDEDQSVNDLWGWVQLDSAAQAFLLAVTKEEGWARHEVFFIVAPTTASDEDSNALRERHWPVVPVKEGNAFAKNTSFFDCNKAELMLGWMHS